jgi:hypothetical protein
MASARDRYIQQLMRRRLAEYNSAVKTYIDQVTALDAKKINTPGFFDYVGGAFVVGSSFFKGYANAQINFGSAIVNAFTGLINDLYETGDSLLKRDFEEAGRDALRLFINPVVTLAEGALTSGFSLLGTASNLIGAIGKEGSGFNDFFKGIEEFTLDGIDLSRRSANASRAAIEGEKTAFDSIFGLINSRDRQDAINRRVIDQEMRDTEIFAPDYLRFFNQSQQGILNKPQGDTSFTYADFVSSNAYATMGISGISDSIVDGIVNAFGLFETTERVQEVFGESRVFQTLKGIFDSVGNIAAMRAVATQAAKMGLSPKNIELSSRGFFFANIAARSTNEAIANGASIQDAFTYGLSIAASESLIENIGGIKFGNIANSAIKQTAKNGITSFLKNAAEEGIEEIIAEFVQPGLEVYKTGELAPRNAKETLTDMLYAFVSGAAASGLSSTGAAIVLNNTVDVRNRKIEERFTSYKNKYGVEIALQKYGIEVQNIVDTLNKSRTQGQVFNEQGYPIIRTLDTKEKDAFINSNNTLKMIVEKNENGQYVLNEKNLAKLTEESFKNKNQSGEVINNQDFAINGQVYGVDISDNGNFDVIPTAQMNNKEKQVFEIIKDLNAPIAIYRTTDPNILTEGKTGTNGVYYLNSANIEQNSIEQITLDIIKHESIHAIKMQSPDVFAALAGTVENLVSIEYNEETGLPVVIFKDKSLEQALPNLQDAIVSSFRSYQNQNIDNKKITDLMSEEIVAYLVDETITDASLLNAIAFRDKTLLSRISDLFGIKPNVETTIPFTKNRQVNKNIKKYANTWRDSVNAYTQRRNTIENYTRIAFGTELILSKLINQSAIQKYGLQNIIDSMETFDPSENTFTINGEKVPFIEIIENMSMDDIRPEKVKTLTDEEVINIFQYDVKKSVAYNASLERYSEYLDSVIDDLPKKEAAEVREKLNIIEQMTDYFISNKKIIAFNDEQRTILAEAVAMSLKTIKVPSTETPPSRATSEQKLLNSMVTRAVNFLNANSGFKFKNRSTSLYMGAVASVGLTSEKQAKEYAHVLSMIIQNIATKDGNYLLRGKYYVEYVRSLDVYATGSTQIIVRPTDTYFKEEFKKIIDKETLQQETQEQEEELNFFERKNLQKYYTNKENAKNTFVNTVSLLERAGLDVKDFTIIESSAGNGVFLDVFREFDPNINVIAYDIAPESKEITQQDFLQLERPFDPQTLVIGNPPYAEGMDVNFINKSLEIAPLVTFVLSGRWNGSYQKQNEVKNAKLIYSQPMGVQSFDIGGKQAFIKVVAQTWVRKDDSRFASFPDISIKNKPKRKHPDFGTMVLIGDRKTYEDAKDFQFDIAVLSRGNGSYNNFLKTYEELKPGTFYTLIKARTPEALSVINSIDFERLADSGSTHIKGFNIYNLIDEYERVKNNTPRPERVKTNTFDSTGYVLTEQQIEFFKDSKVRDEQGNLIRLYHGSLSSDITNFSTEFYGQKTGIPEKFLFFTNNLDTAKEFSLETKPGVSKFINVATGVVGTVYDTYLNIKNPLDLGNLSEKDIQFIVQSYADNFNVTYQEGLDWISRNNLSNQQFLKIAFNAQQVEQAGYDGLIAEMYIGTGVKEYAALNGSQIKSVFNDAPKRSNNIYDKVRPEKTKTRKLTDQEKAEISDFFNDDEFISTYFEKLENGNLVLKNKNINTSNVKKNYAKIQFVDGTVRTFTSNEYVLNVDLGSDFEIPLRYQEKDFSVVKLSEIKDNTKYMSIYHLLKSLGIRFIAYTGSTADINSALGFSVTRNKNDAVFINFEVISRRPEGLFKTVIHELTHEIFKTNRKDLIPLIQYFRDAFVVKDPFGAYAFSDTFEAFLNEYSNINGANFLDYLDDGYSINLKTPQKLFTLLEGFLDGTYDLDDPYIKANDDINEFIAQVTGYLMSSPTTIKSFKGSDFSQIPLFQLYEKMISSTKSQWLLSKTAQFSSNFHNAYLAHRRIMMNAFPSNKNLMNLPEINSFIKTFSDGKFTTRSKLIQQFLLEKSSGKNGEATNVINNIIYISSKYASTVTTGTNNFTEMKNFFEDQLKVINELLDNPVAVEVMSPNGIIKDYSKLNKILKALLKKSYIEGLRITAGRPDLYNYIFGKVSDVNDLSDIVSDLVERYLEIGDDILRVFDLADKSTIERIFDEFINIKDNLELELENILLKDPSLVSNADKQLHYEFYESPLILKLKELVDALQSINNSKKDEYKVISKISKVQSKILEGERKLFISSIEKYYNRAFQKINSGKQAKSDFNVELSQALEAVAIMISELKKDVFNDAQFKKTVFDTMEKLKDLLLLSERIRNIYGELGDDGKIDVAQTQDVLKKKFLFGLYGSYGVIFDAKNITESSLNIKLEDQVTLEKLGFNKNYNNFAKYLTQLLSAFETRYKSVFGEVEHKVLAGELTEKLLDIQSENEEGIPRLKGMEKDNTGILSILNIMSQTDLSTRQDLLLTFANIFDGLGLDFFKTYFELYKQTLQRRDNIVVEFSKRAEEFKEENKGILDWEVSEASVPEGLTFELTTAEYDLIKRDVEKSISEDKEKLAQARRILKSAKDQQKENRAKKKKLHEEYNNTPEFSPRKQLIKNEIAALRIDIQTEANTIRSLKRYVDDLAKSLKGFELTFKERLFKLVDQKGKTTAKMTRGELVNLYMNVLREQNMEDGIKKTSHFSIGNRFNIFDSQLAKQNYEKAKKKSKEKIYVVHLPRETMIEDMEAEFATDERYNVLIEEARFTYDKNYEYINEIFKAKFEVDLPKEEYYSPYRTADSDFSRNWDLKRKNRINLSPADGFTLELTTGATTALAIQNVTSVMSGVTTAAANYSFERLITDFQNLSVTKGENLNSTFLEVLNQLDGGAFFKIFNDTFTDLLGYGFERDRKIEQIFNDFLNLSTASIMSMSASVFLKQFISILTISIKQKLPIATLTQNVLKHGIPFKNTYLKNWLLENNSQMYIRDKFKGVEALAETVTADTFSRISAVRNKLNAVFGGLNNWADSTVLVAAFATIVSQVEKDNPNLTELEVLEKANKIFNDTVMLFGVASINTGFRSKFSTSKSFIQRFLAKFMSENIMQISGIRRSIAEYRAGVGTTQDILETSSAFVISSLVSAIIGSAFSFLNGYTDEDEILQDFLLNELVLQNIIGAIPYFNIITSVFQFVDGSFTKVYDPKIPLISDTILLVERVADMGISLFTGKSIWKPMLKFLEAFSVFFGIPGKNLTRLYSYISRLETAFGGESFYKFEEFYYSKSAAQQLNEAVKKGDDQKIQVYTQRMFDNNRVKEEILKTLLSDDEATLNLRNVTSFTAKNPVNGKMETIDIPEKTQEKYKLLTQRALSRIVSTSSYKRLTPKKKAEAMQRVINYYYNFMKNELLVQKYKDLPISVKREIDYDKMRKKKMLGTNEVIINALRDY